MEVCNSKINSNQTRVYCEDLWKYNAPHHFTVKSVDGKDLCNINFQEGPIKECGVNGVSNEDLLLMVLTRLEGFQMSEYKCNENQEAILAINEALDSLRKRTMKRKTRSVEGTSEI